MNNCVHGFICHTFFLHEKNVQNLLLLSCWLPFMLMLVAELTLVLFSC